MTGEIDRDFFCPYYVDRYCILMGNNRLCNSEGCPQLGHKWPTPEQFREKWGVEWPDGGAVYCKSLTPKENKESVWHIFSFYWFKENQSRYQANGETLLCVCACTPWGKPEDNWRPS